MNKLNGARRASIIRALCEGNSVRATSRMTGAAKATVLKLLVEMGEFCSLYQDHVLVSLPCERIEADEIWAFVGAKKKNATKAGQGDIWTFTALCATTKLMVSWFVGTRTSYSAGVFMEDVAKRLKNRVQVSTDNHIIYTDAVWSGFGWNGADYATIDKTYGNTMNPKDPTRRYSPGYVTGVQKERKMGNPDMENVSTSYVERQNLTMRMSMRRFTRLTNAFSKKAENHAHAVSLHFMYYNFLRPHTTLTKERNGTKTTPAMAAGVTDHVWTVEELLSVMQPTIRL